MIGDVFENWGIENGELLRTNTRGTNYDTVKTAQAAERAKEMLGIEAPSTGGYVVPLFAKNDPNPTNQYVVYKPDRGAIKWYDTGFGISGAERTAACQKLNDTVIGHRLRFWLPEYQPDIELPFDESDLPPDHIDPADKLSDSEEEAFFDHLRTFVRTEMEAQRATNWELYDDLGIEGAIRRRQVSGPFFPVAQVSTNDGKQAFVFQMEEDDDNSEIDLRGDEGLFQGNFCIADIESDTDDFPLEVELLKVGDSKLTLQPDWTDVSNRPVIEKHLNSDTVELWLHELLNPVPYNRRLKAIKQVRSNEQKKELLTGKRSVRFNANKYSILGGDIELNDHQQLALAWADGAEDVVCIHGPPGTGKTRTLTAFVKQAVDRGKSVLVTAHSNQAVDNLLVGDSTSGDPEEETLHAMAQDPDESLTIARTGNNTRNRVVESNYLGKSVSRADVVASTTSGAAQFDPDSFDIAVVDEATQASRPATAIALNAASKLVLAGDHKQLPPYCADETMQEEDTHISLFEYLLNRYGEDISVMLLKQYRMNEEIAEFPNKSFYGGELETADRNRDWTIHDLNPMIGVDISGTERRQSHGKSYYNKEEAEAVAKQVKLLVQSGLDPEDIGVITAYTGQIGPIGSRINNLDVENPERVTVDTVDSFQGGEREAIIVSFVRSNSDGRSGFLEFPEEGPRRLNVALTRARKRLVVIGNWDTLGTVAPHRSEDVSCAHHYENMAQHLRSRDMMLSLRKKPE